jgi:hypothetical protein
VPPLSSPLLIIICCFACPVPHHICPGMLLLVLVPEVFPQPSAFVTLKSVFLVSETSLCFHKNNLNIAMPITVVIYVLSYLIHFIHEHMFNGKVKKTGIHLSLSRCFDHTVGIRFIPTKDFSQYKLLQLDAVVSWAMQRGENNPLQPEHIATRRSVVTQR